MYLNCTQHLNTTIADHASDNIGIIQGKIQVTNTSMWDIDAAASRTLLHWHWQQAAFHLEAGDSFEFANNDGEL